MRVCHFAHKSSIQKSENLVPNIDTQKFRNLPKIDTANIWEPKTLGFPSK